MSIHALARRTHSVTDRLSSAHTSGGQGFVPFGRGGDIPEGSNRGGAGGLPPGLTLRLSNFGSKLVTVVNCQQY